MKKRFFIASLIIIPFISIFLIVTFRAKLYPTNEEIINGLKGIKYYKADIEYIIKNSHGEYKEDATIFFGSDMGMRIEFEGNRAKVYKDDSIKVIKDEKQYQINSSFDYVYPLPFMSYILENNINEIYTGTEEWGDKEYLEVVIKLSDTNRHISYGKLYIDKEEREPIGIKIYDIEDNESIIIRYNNFTYLKNIDEKLFE